MLAVITFSKLEIKDEILKVWYGIAHINLVTGFLSKIPT